MKAELRDARSVNLKPLVRSSLLEISKYLGDFRLEYVQRTHNRRFIVFEGYMADKLRFHLHAVNRDDSSLSVCLMFRSVYNFDAINSLALNKGELPVLAHARLWAGARLHFMSFPGNPYRLVVVPLF